MDNVSVKTDSFCSGCGLCASVCPVKAISIVEQCGFLRPVVSESCIFCRQCVKNCPCLNGSQKTEYHDFSYRLWGHSNNGELRTEAASGGITTSLLVYLLEEKIIDYVITSDTYRNNKYGRFTVIDFNSRAALYDFAGSNYCPVDIGGSLEYVQTHDGRCAIVCLPCLARGIHEWKELHSDHADKILYVISLLCNHVPSYHATDYLFSQYKIQRDICKIKYRGGGWFGSFRAFHKLDDKCPAFNVVFTEYFSSGFSEFFWQPACVNCTDHFGYYADVSMGDADFVKYREQMQSGHSDNPGETMCFSNNEVLISVLYEMEEKKLITLSQNVSDTELIRIYAPLSENNRAGKNSLTNDVQRVQRLEQKKGSLMWKIQNKLLKFLRIFR